MTLEHVQSEHTCLYHCSKSKYPSQSLSGSYSFVKPSFQPESPVSIILRVNMSTPEGLAYRGLPFAEFIVCCRRRRRLMHYGTFMAAIEKERGPFSFSSSSDRLREEWAQNGYQMFRNSTPQPTIEEAHSTSPLSLSPFPFLFLHWVFRNETY